MGTIQINMQVWKRKFERNLQDYGLKTALAKTLAYAFSFAYKHTEYRLYRIDLIHDKTEKPSLIEGVEFRMLSPNDQAAIRQIEEAAEWLKGSVTRRLKDGSICIAAFDGGQLAGFNLISFGSVFMPLVKVARKFPDQVAWSEHIATVKTFRKKGLAAQLRYRIFEELRQRGCRKLYGGALVDNTASLQLARRVGFHEFVEIHYTSLLGFQGWRYVRVKN